VWLGNQVFKRLGLVGEHQVPEPVRRWHDVDHGKVAEQAIAQGDLVGAVRALYRQLIAGLIHSGRIQDQPGLSAGDCRRAVAALPDIYPKVDAATTIFEKVAYGNWPPDETDIKVLQEAGKTTRAA